MTTTVSAKPGGRASFEEATNKGGKKRKRTKRSREDQYLAESADRHEKLHHACSKKLRREAKVVKSFECQKIVRAIKTLVPDEKSSKDDGGRKEARLQTLQRKLHRTKKADIDVLVQVGLKRLGVLSLNPLDLESAESARHENSKDDAAEAVQSPGNSRPKKPPQPFKDATAASQSDDPFYRSLLESMFQHKRLSEALDELNEKVAEYRKWSMSRRARLLGEGSKESDPRGFNGKKKNKHQQGKMPRVDKTLVGHEGAAGLFIGSLSGIPGEEDEEWDDNHGIEDGDFSEDDSDAYREVKKNRPGQRARRAKAMAIQARKLGKTWDSSINWRDEKKNKGENDRDRARGDEATGNGAPKGNRAGRKAGDDGARRKEAERMAVTGKRWKEEGNSHPSWAAAAARKSQASAKFQGTRITFD